MRVQKAKGKSQDEPFPEPDGRVTGEHDHNGACTRYFYGTLETLRGVLSKGNPVFGAHFTFFPGRETPGLINRSGRRSLPLCVKLGVKTLPQFFTHFFPLFVLGPLLFSLPQGEAVRLGRFALHPLRGDEPIQYSCAGAIFQNDRGAKNPDVFFPSPFEKRANRDYGETIVIWAT